MSLACNIEIKRHFSDFFSATDIKEVSFLYEKSMMRRGLWRKIIVLNKLTVKYFFSNHKLDAPYFVQCSLCNSVIRQSLVNAKKLSFVIKSSTTTSDLSITRRRFTRSFLCFEFIQAQRWSFAVDRQVHRPLRASYCMCMYVLCVCLCMRVCE